MLLLRDKSDIRAIFDNAVIRPTNIPMTSASSVSNILTVSVLVESVRKGDLKTLISNYFPTFLTIRIEYSQSLSKIMKTKENVFKSIIKQTILIARKDPGKVQKQPSVGVLIKKCSENML